ncbi:MAG: DUF6785 family protein [Armatimonadia bacterium]
MGNETFQRGLTLRSTIVFLAAITLTMVWVLRTELLTGSYATGGTPPAIAVGWLLFLAGTSALGQRVWKRLGLTRAELFTIYACMALAVPMASYGIMRAFLPHLTVLSYFAQPTNRYAEMWSQLPDWQVVRDDELIRQCYEGAQNEGVPWGAWLPVLGRWSLLFIAVFVCITGMLTFFRRRWVEGDRLQFPILYLPTQILPKPGEAINLFRNPIFYIGFGGAFLFNLTNVLQAMNPGFPGLGTVTDLGDLFTEAPWTALRPFRWHHFPQVVGLGYLVNLEVLFSVWFFFLANKGLAVGARVFGYDNSNMPYMFEQCSGGYPVMALVLVFMARKEILGILRRALAPNSEKAERNEILPDWGAALAFFGGFGFLVCWCVVSGMNGLLAAIFFATILAYSLVYARIRAEAGIPYCQIYPTDYPIKNLQIFLGARGLLAFGKERNLVLLSSLGWLSYHYYSHFMAAYQIDGLRLADEADMRRREMATALLGAMIIGFAGAAWAHLTAYYQYGQNIVDGGTGLGDHRAKVAMQTYDDMDRLITTMGRPDTTRALFAVAGGVVTLALASLRFFFLRFPLHPVGYLVSTAYWNECPIWGDILLTWVVKTLVLRLGGARLYRQLIPCFVGLAIGQFFWGGLVWGNITPFIAPEIAKRYWLPRV